VHQRALAAVQERAREIIEGALAVLLFTAVAFQSGLVVIDAPGTDVVALTSGALQGPIFPAQRMDISVTRALVQLNGDIFFFYKKSLGDLNVEKFTHPTRP
jgi:hypothetical protein